MQSAARQTSLALCETVVQIIPAEIQGLLAAHEVLSSAMTARVTVVISLLLLPLFTWGTDIDFQIYHTTDQILDFYKTSAAQHPSLVRYVWES